jgi:hypothetical protein
MPSATGKLYGNGLLSLLNGAVVWGTDDTYLALASSSYTVDIDAHDFWNDVVANEVTGTNWAANGQQADGETLSLVTANNDIEMDITDEVVAAVTLTDGKHVILYTRTPGTDATRELVGYATMDTALAPQGGTLTLDFAATGWALIDYT